MANYQSQYTGPEIDAALGKAEDHEGRVQALESGFSGKLASLSGLSGAANKLPYLSGASTFALADLSAAGRSLIAGADAAAQRTTLGLGDAAMKQTVTSYTDATHDRVLTTGAGGILRPAGQYPTTYDFSGFVSPSGLYWCNSAGSSGLPFGYGTVLALNYAQSAQHLLVMRADTSQMLFGGVESDGTYRTWNEVWHSGNTTVDGSGFLLEASPIVRLYDDGTEEPVKPVGAGFEKLGTGVYRLTGVPPLATRGWRMQVPVDGQGNRLLVLGEPEQDGSHLVIRAYAPDWQGGRLEAGAPADIPAGHFVLLRFWEAVEEGETPPTVTPPPAEEVAEREAAAERARIKARRDAAINAGITVNGIDMPTDDKAQARVTGAAVQALVDSSVTVQWKLADDSFVVLTAEQILGIAQALRAHVQACFDREAEILAALEGGAPYDIAAGWP